jgi:uncharacterized membrane protein (DUF485 family)
MGSHPIEPGAGTAGPGGGPGDGRRRDDGGPEGPDGAQVSGVPNAGTPVRGSHSAGAVDQPAVDFTQVQDSEQFQELRKRHRSFVFPMAVVFLLWYFAYVLLADYAHDFMATPVFGNVNIGILLGLLQFVSTFAITMWYVSYANRRLDPIAADLRNELESAAPEAFSDPTGGTK